MADAAMIIPDEYQRLLDSIGSATGNEARQYISEALKYVNQNGSNASYLLYLGETFDGSTFALVDGSANDKGLREYFGDELITRTKP